MIARFNLPHLTIPTIAARSRLPILCVVMTGMLGLVACHDRSPPTPSTQTAEHFAYAAIARGKVDVDGGVVALAFPESGVVQAVHVNIGDQVQRGQVLAELNPAAASLAVDAAAAELTQSKAQAEAQSTRLPTALRTAERWQKAAKLGAAQQQQADDAALAVAQLQADQAVAQSAIQISVQKLATARYNRDRQILRAPQDGEIIQRDVQVGSLQSPEHAILTLLPRQPLIVRAEVNESFVPKLRLGMKADLTSDSNSTGSQSLSTAHVIRIGKVFEDARLGSDTQQNNRVVQCVLALDTPSAGKTTTASSPAATATPVLLIGQNVLVKFYD